LGGRTEAVYEEEEDSEEDASGDRDVEPLELDGNAEEEEQDEFEKAVMGELLADDSEESEAE
jgi:hypothetical protein